jgi:hypothetical protein
MAIRVTEAQVKEVIDTELTEEQVRPFLDAASALVDDTLLTDDEGVSLGYGDTILAQIEKWLAAHFVAVRDPRITEEELGEGRARYAVPTGGKGLEATVYGKQAMVLDHKGILKEISETTMTAKIEVIELDLL